MAASASLTIPVNLSTPVQQLDVNRIFQATAGLKGITLDAAASTATVQFEFPGNIDALIGRLRAKRLTTAQTVTIAIPVVNLSGKVVDPTQLLHALNLSPAVSNATYDGHTVTATIVAATNASRYMYEEIVIAGLMPLDMPTVAGPQEFVL